MKIIGVHRLKSKEGQAHKGLLVWPDSTFLRTGKPVFIPSEEERTIMMGLAARIMHVGKSIMPKFSRKYYNEIAPIAFNLISEAAADIAAGLSPNADHIVEDFAVVCGDFSDKTNFGDKVGLSVETRPLYVDAVNKEADTDCGNSSGPNGITLADEIADAFAALDEAIAFASQRNTLKTGDIVAAILPSLSFKAVPDTLVSARLNGLELLNTKLK